jgi:hypothetical protein
MGGDRGTPAGLALRVARDLAAVAGAFAAFAVAVRYLGTGSTQEDIWLIAGSSVALVAVAWGWTRLDRRRHPGRAGPSRRDPTGRAIASLLVCFTVPAVTRMLRESGSSMPTLLLAAWWATWIAAFLVLGEVSEAVAPRLRRLGQGLSAAGARVTIAIPLAAAVIAMLVADLVLAGGHAVHVTCDGLPDDICADFGPKLVRLGPVTWVAAVGVAAAVLRLWQIGRATAGQVVAGAAYVAALFWTEATVTDALGGAIAVNFGAFGAAAGCVLASIVLAIAAVGVVGPADRGSDDAVARATTTPDPSTLPADPVTPSRG